MKIFRPFKINLVLILFLFFSSNSFTQTFNIGHTSTVLYDNARIRDVTTEIYYPADSNGDDVSISIGNFPVIVWTWFFNKLGCI